jgi:hypothetical protein
MRESRIQYFESVEVIEAVAANPRHDSVKSQDDKILHRQILGAMDAKTRAMCALRGRGHSWKEVGRTFGIKAHNAEVQFWYGLDKAKSLLEIDNEDEKSGRQKK